MADSGESVLSEEEVLRLEQSIPACAAIATHAAFRRALGAGQSVLRVEGDWLVQVNPDGSQARVRRSAPRRKVVKGQVISVRRVDDAGAQA